MIRKERRQSIDDAHFKLDAPYKDRDYKNAKYAIDNISRGGLRFCSQDVFCIDDLISVSIYLDKEMIHNAQCRICYFEHHNDSPNGDCYGLSFIDKFIDMKFCQ